MIIRDLPEIRLSCTASNEVCVKCVLEISTASGIAWPSRSDQVFLARLRARAFSASVKKQGCPYSVFCIQCSVLFLRVAIPAPTVNPKSWKPDEGQIVLGFLIHYS